MSRRNSLRELALFVLQIRVKITFLQHLLQQKTSSVKNLCPHSCTVRTYLRELCELGVLGDFALHEVSLSMMALDDDTRSLFQDQHGKKLQG